MQIAVRPCKHNPSLFSHHLCDAAFPVFHHQLWQQSCHTRKQIIIKVTEQLSDNTKEQHWHISTVPGHRAISVYGPTSTQLLPLEFSIITTPSDTVAFLHRDSEKKNLLCTNWFIYIKGFAFFKFIYFLFQVASQHKRYMYMCHNVVLLVSSVLFFSVVVAPPRSQANIISKWIPWH